LSSHLSILLGIVKKNEFGIINSTYILKSVKLLLSIVALNDIELKQADVTQASCLPDLKETYTVSVPWSFVWLLETEQIILRTETVGSLLEQEAEAKLKELEFKPCLCDPCIYVRFDEEKRPFYIALYVDDLIYAYHDYQKLSSFIKAWKRIRISAGWVMHHNYLGLI